MVSLTEPVECALYDFVDFVAGIAPATSIAQSVDDIDINPKRRSSAAILPDT